jgi:tetratricopeptide (TPR) repeat protein
MDEYEKAETLFLSSLEERRKLAKENPREYTPALASTLYELAGVRYTMSDYVEAERMYNEVLALRRELFKRNPSAYRRVFVDTLEALVKVYEITGKKQKEEKIQKVLKEVQSAA